MVVMISAPTKDLTGLKFGRLTVLHKCDWKDAKGQLCGLVFASAGLCDIFDIAV